MPRNFFITGLPKSGKTTILRKLIEEFKKRGLKVGGFISPEEREHGTREGFYVQDIDTGRIGRLASTKGDGPKVSKYHVDIKSFESIAVPIMKKVDEYDVLIIDEIGRMEMKSKKFVELLDEVFESQTPVIASIHQDYVLTYAVNGEIFVVTPTTREAVFIDLLNKATQEYSRVPPEEKIRKKEKPPRKEKKRKKEKRKGKEKTKKGKGLKEEKKTEERKELKEERERAKEEEKKEEEKDKKEERSAEKPAQRGIIRKFRELLGF
ncbi:MAG: NTPase [Candidatus Bilamarchaeaceae archaeon]